jgi:hypothetical protein
MDRKTGVITRPTFRMWMRPNGVVQVAWPREATVLLEDATSALEAMALLTGGRRCLSRIVANLFLRIKKRRLPDRSFDNKASALAWLETFAVDC